MNRPAYVIAKANRFTDFSVTLRFDGLDLTGKTLRAQVRPSPNDNTGPVVTLGMVGAGGVTGFRILAAGTTSIASMFIKKADLAQFTSSTDDEDVYLAWDLQMIDGSNISDVIAYGPFILRAGVTQ